MSSEIDIYNMALSHVGTTVTVQDKNERSVERIVCSRFYETARDALLAYKSCDWRFAETSELLADLGSPPTNWLYRYAFPNDCIRPMYIVIPGLQAPRDDQRIVFQVSAGAESRVILTNQPKAELRYIQRSTEAERFTAPFVEALALRLAAMIAMPLVKDKSLRNELMGLSEQAIQVAMAFELNQAQPEQEPRSIYEQEMHA